MSPGAASGQRHPALCVTPTQHTAAGELDAHLTACPDHTPAGPATGTASKKASSGSTNPPRPSACAARSAGSRAVRSVAHHSS